MQHNIPFHTLPRFMYAENLSAGNTLRIDGKLLHYLKNVMRLRENDLVRIFNQRDGEWTARVQACNRDAIFIVIEKILRPPFAQTPTPIFLGAALLRSTAFDNLVVKSVELGIAGIQPIIAARSQVRKINQPRAQRMSIEAAEQSERLDVPRILDVMHLQEWLDKWPAGMLPLICAEFGNAQPIADGIAQAHAIIKSASHNGIALITGPEGGFTESELDALSALPHAICLRLGERILRADTAALAAIACWQALAGDWRQLS